MMITFHLTLAVFPENEALLPIVTFVEDCHAQIPPPYCIISISSVSFLFYIQ